MTGAGRACGGPPRARPTPRPNMASSVSPKARRSCTRRTGSGRMRWLQALSGRTSKRRSNPLSRRLVSVRSFRRIFRQSPSRNNSRRPSHGWRATTRRMSPEWCSPRTAGGRRCSSPTQTGPGRRPCRSAQPPTRLDALLLISRRTIAAAAPDTRPAYGRCGSMVVSFRTAPGRAVRYFVGESTI